MILFRKEQAVFKMKKIKRKGLTGDSITSILFWVVLLALAIGAVYLLVRRLAG